VSKYFVSMQLVQVFWSEHDLQLLEHYKHCPLFK